MKKINKNMQFFNNFYKKLKILLKSKKFFDKIYNMKNVIISGASGDIGKAIANSLSKNYNLILLYNKNDITPLAKSLNAQAYKIDLSVEREVEQFANLIKEKYHTIYGLVNCAGVSLIKQVQDCTSKDYNFVMDNNFKTNFYLTKHLAPLMISQKQGSIVNISSMWGVVGASMEALYSASKGAINSFTLALAKELGPSNIRVNAICPGLIKSKMNTKLNEQEINDIVLSTPLNRIGTPEDVANVVKFLIGEEASFITGQVITVDGGLTL